jgi:hypothetical protein
MKLAHNATSNRKKATAAYGEAGALAKRAQAITDIVEQHPHGFGRKQLVCLVNPFIPIGVVKKASACPASEARPSTWLFRVCS